jgi:hypothetical protein
VFYYLFGAAAALDDCDHAEPFVVKNRSTAPLAWRRVGTAAAAATASPVTSISNVGNARYSPAKGRITLRIAGYVSAGGTEVLLACGPNGPTDGRLWIDTVGGLRLILDDAAGVTVVNVNGGAVTSAEHTYTFEWNAAAGTASISEGGVVLGSAAVAPWTPEPNDVTPIYVGSHPTANQARCNIALLQLVNT